MHGQLRGRHRAMGARAQGRADVFNIFLDYPVEEQGKVAIDHDAPSKPGDHIDLRAEMDLVAVISNCPQENNPCNGFNPTPIRATVFAAE